MATHGHRRGRAFLVLGRWLWPGVAVAAFAVNLPISEGVLAAAVTDPPPLLFGGGESTYLEEGLAPPLGVTAEPDFTEHKQDMWTGSTLLLYTDGLVERRRESIQLGLDRLRTVAVRHEDKDIDGLCDAILSSLMDPDHVADDIALLAMRP